jgi:hypothetical protein
MLNRKEREKMIDKKPRRPAPVKPKRDPYRPSEAFYVIWLIWAGIIFIILWASIGGAS